MTVDIIYNTKSIMMVKADGLFTRVIWPEVTMDFVHLLQIFWEKQGFKRLNYASRNIWIREDADQVSIVDIIPERLPGQHREPLSALEEEIREIERRLMVQTGKMTDRLTLMVCSDLPDQGQLNETMTFTNIWWVDRKEDRILVYENQRPDFLGCRRALEEYLEDYRSRKRNADRSEWKRTFTPVTVVLVLLNIVIFFVAGLGSGQTGAGSVMSKGILNWDAVVEQKQYYRLFTSMFLHFGAEHLFQNMLILMLTGCRLERAAGRIRTLCIYLGSGLAAGLTSLFFTLRGTEHVAAGASGAIFGIMGGLLCLILKDTVSGTRRYYQEIGLTGVIFMIVCAASYGFFEAGIDNAAHIGGLAGGFILTWLLTLADGL